MHGTTAVVSLFNPSESVLANAAALLSQTAGVVVVDDGSPQETSPILEQLAAMGCQVVRLEQNSGIATALNTGITVALGGTPKPEYVLTMDQDSLL
ncbi:MAG: glycosyltransferase, partial [Actinomycetes bacterium]